MFPVKNGLKFRTFLYTGLQKSFPTHYSLKEGGIFRAFFKKTYTALNVAKLAYFLDVRVSCT